MISSAYVFVEGLERFPLICGEIRLDEKAGVGRFRYGKSYLTRSDAFALDPLHLPLTDEIFTTTLNHGIFGVLADAGADSWGRKLITQLQSTKPKNELEYLLAGASMGVGAISFSLSRDRAKSKISKNSIDDIDLLIAGKNKIINSEAVNEEVRKAFIYGVSMGGARPKTVLTHENTEYLVKFNRADDLFNVCRVEHATMSMLKELVKHVAETEILAGAEDLLLVKRFDRDACEDSIRTSQHFITANSLLLEGKISELAGKTWYSYAAFAEILRKYSDVATDAQELFQRMVFNILIGNTDDHARNHAMLYDLKQHIWRLSPAFDVLPVNNSKQHSMGIGDEGRLGSIENAMSQYRRFGLSQDKAKHFVQQTKELIREWPTYMRKAGVGEGDIERLKGIINEIH